MDPDDRLRFLFASAFEHGVPTDLCPDPDTMLDALLSRGSADERAGVVDHLSGCSVCAEVWRIASLQREQDTQRVDGEIRDRMAIQVRRVCPSWLMDQCDDLVQMSMVKLLRTTSESEMPNAFLRRVAYSVVVDEIRRLKRRNEVGMSPSMPDRIANSGDLTPETQARGFEIGRTLVEVLETLAPARRRAVTLYLQDHSVPEVAEILGFDRKKVSNLVYRGLADLREALRERGVVP